MTINNKQQHKEMANAIRILSMDAVEKANSGHPGMPMGMADVATILFTEFLKFDPTNPDWPNRDRFILSAGHGSMLLYSLLYLTGYQDISIDDIKEFRQLGSKTAGHPEYGLLNGIETTTGPLGQGLANAVGMAIAEKMQAARDHHTNHYTYVVVGDGCLMEGISQEAISLAGHLKLNKLIVLFDDNQITIDGPTNLSISEDTLARFKASEWNAERIDGHNHEQIRQALNNAKNSDKPSLIACRTIIGYGAPTKSGSHHCHGAALGNKEAAQTRQILNWPHEPFIIPDNILKLWREAGSRYKSNAASTTSFKKLNSNCLITLKKQFLEKQTKISTRKASGIILSELCKEFPNLIGGSADLSGSNNTKPETSKAINSQDFSGQYIYYGIREHAMAAIMNGIALDGNFIPYSGSFLVFSDYCRPAIRLSALMGLKLFYIMTHDSIGVGEDGPTHQPIEHLASLRAIPNLYIFRPACGIETLECYEAAINIDNAPSLFALTRQDIPEIRKENTENLSRFGAYIISEYEGELKVTIFATGSEVNIALETQIELHKQNIGTRIVSIPCFELFDQQSPEYQSNLLDNSSLKVAVEAGCKQGWERYIGRDGIFIGMEGFGASAPAEKLYEYFGISKENIIKNILNKL